jgi:hypothetical protein
MALPFLQQAAANPPQLPTGPTVAPFDPSQVAGQEKVLGAAAGPQQDLATQGAQTSQFLSGDVLKPESNPALASYMDAAVKPLYQNLTESTLPAIRSAAESAGPFGGSRQGIAEGLAAGRTAQAAGATTAQIANQGYQGGLDALVKNLGLLPNTIQAQLAPGISTSGVGDVRQQMVQALLNDTNLRETYPQLLPLLMGQTLAGIGASFQPTGSSTTGTASAANPLLQGAGLGIAGLGALGQAGGAGGAAGALGSLGGGLSALGAGAGEGLTALLPFLAMSDRRLKRNIKRIGELENGVPVYEFQFKHSDVVRVGCMADEVPEDCVYDIMGFKAVDYGKLLSSMGV